MHPVAERYIGETGTAEAHWRALLSRVQRLELDEWVRPDARLVVVSPHPDDEILGCGGMLASHVERGGKAMVVALTNGEASHPDSETWSPVALGQVRRVESERGLRVLGIHERAVVRLGFPDGALSRYAGPLRESLGLLVQPGDVVVSTWRHDGHADHEIAGEMSQQVCAEARVPCLQAPVWMWHWSRVGDPRVPWHLLRGLSLTKDVVERKACALSAHVTQLTPRSDHQGPVLDPLIVERASREAEYFFVQP